ncbi:MAG: hypothetical protein LBL46_01800, partial [Rickettsiales bacterium]|nr:hypothetical protein [Rickettsiales bacterium]
NDSLTSCIKDGESVTDADWYSDGKIGTIVEMLMMNLDNNLLAGCEKVMEDTLTSVCGDAECHKAFNAKDFGTANLGYSIDTAAKTDGTAPTYDITWTGKIDDFSAFRPEEAGTSASSLAEDGSFVSGITRQYPYLAFEKTAADGTTTTAGDGEKAIQRAIDTAISSFMSNEKIKFCTEGRDLSQIKTRDKNAKAGDRTKTEARFPRLADTYITRIINNGLVIAEKNYYTKFSKLNTEAMEEVRVAKLAKAASDLEKCEIENSFIYYGSMAVKEYDEDVTVSCNNETFTDPLSGYLKQCFVGGKYYANENGTFKMPKGGGKVMYGAISVVSVTPNEQIMCKESVLGDPNRASPSTNSCYDPNGGVLSKENFPFQLDVKRTACLTQYQAAGKANPATAPAADDTAKK